MWWFLGLLALTVAAIPLYVGLSRATELFVLEVAGSSVRLVRGRIPPGLLSDLKEVIRRARITKARLRARSEGGRATLELRGEVSSDAAQQLRNVLGTYPLARIRAGRR